MLCAVTVRRLLPEGITLLEEAISRGDGQLAASNQVQVAVNTDKLPPLALPATFARWCNYQTYQTRDLVSVKPGIKLLTIRHLASGYAYCPASFFASLAVSGKTFATIS